MTSSPSNIVETCEQFEQCKDGHMVCVHIAAMLKFWWASQVISLINWPCFWSLLVEAIQHIFSNVHEFRRGMQQYESRRESHHDLKKEEQSCLLHPKVFQ